jgi:hypothetical protein
MMLEEKYKYGASDRMDTMSCRSRRMTNMGGELKSNYGSSMALDHYS